MVNDLKRLLVVQLGHTFDFPKLDIVSTLEGVAFVLVDSDETLLVLSNAGDNELLAWLSIHVVDLVVVTIVKEDVASGSESLCKDEANALSAAGLVESEVLFLGEEVLCQADNVVVEVVCVLKLVDDRHLDVWVEFSELITRCFSARSLVNIAFPQVEVRTEVTDASHCWVVDIHRLWASKDQVLGSLDTESSHTDDEHLHLDKLAHSLDSESSDLSGVEIVIDLHVFC